MKKRSLRLRITFDAASHSARVVEPHYPRPVVLVLDDDPTNCRMVRVLLEVAVGARILEAETKDQALKLAKQVRPDLLISNLVSPRTMDGLEYVQPFRAANPGVPVIVVSGSLDPVSRSCGLEFGTPGCVSKMMVWSDLLETVRRALSEGNATVVISRLARREATRVQIAERCLCGRWADPGKMRYR